MRRAHQEDVPLLIELMTLFYAESHYTLDRTRAADAFDTLLSREHLGHIWLIEEGGKAIGYVVLIFRFSMEYGGRIACIDDLYILRDHRNRGLGTAALEHIRVICEELGLRAITVEAAPNNSSAQRVYCHLGFKEESGRQLLVLPLTKPVHVV